MHYTYDLAGDLVSWSHPAGFTIGQGYNPLQQLSVISSSLNDNTHPGMLATINYSYAGPVAQMYEGNSSFEEVYDYNNRLQLVRLQNIYNGNIPTNDSCWVYNYYGGSDAPNPTSCVVPTLPTLRNNNGNVMGYYYQDSVNTSLGHTASFGYDYLNRLTSSVATPSQNGGAAYNLAFTYDRYGNMSCQTNSNTNGPCPNWTFQSTTNQINNSGFSCDPAGNLIGDGTHTYQWHAEGWLLGVDGNNTAGYVYNALGWRVEKKVGSAYTEILYDQSGESLGENNRSSWTQSYVNFMGRHLAIYTNGQTGATYFPHVNALGSTTAVTDYTGALVEDRPFYPWGQDWQVAGTLYEERFAKLQHRDSETSLDPTPNRMFSSTQGRWLSPDPLFGNVSNPQTLNLYPYVAGNPTSRVDPSGKILMDPNAGSCGPQCGDLLFNIGNPDLCPSWCPPNLPIFLPLLLGSGGCGGSGGGMVWGCTCKHGSGTWRWKGCSYECDCTDGTHGTYDFNCGLWDKYAWSSCPSELTECHTPGPSGRGSIWCTSFCN